MALRASEHNGSQLPCPPRTPVFAALGLQDFLTMFSITPQAKGTMLVSEINAPVFTRLRERNTGL